MGSYFRVGVIAQQFKQRSITECGVPRTAEPLVYLPVGWFDFVNSKSVQGSIKKQARSVNVLVRIAKI